jgi:antitoxin HigA-1
MLMRFPPHPGRLVRSELDELNIPVAEAAKALGITRQQLYNVINGKSSISPEMAVRLAKGIGSTAETWLKLQQAFDLAALKVSAIKVTKLQSRAA